MKKQDIHIGCSGHYNKEWIDIFYPPDIPKNKWFEYYCRHFTTYELNSTFYRFPSVKTLKGWYDKAPEGFLYSAKVPRLITHFRKFSGCDKEIQDFYSNCREGLAEKLACILFQLPPSFDYSPERLELILKSLNPDFKNAIEFRNESWWKPEVYQALSANNVTFCNVSYPKLPDTINAFVNTSPIGYVRFHGVPKLFYSGYTADELERFKNLLIKQEKFSKAFIYFNNTASRAGIINAMEMQKLIGTK